MTARPTIDFRTTQIVVKELSMQPYVGFENSVDIPDGWLYDIKRWCSPFDLRLPSLPRLTSPSSQGVTESEYFRSGVGSVASGDLDLSSIESSEVIFPRSIDEITEGTIEDSERRWLPWLRHGTYFRFKTEYFYYSDESVIQTISTTDNRDSRNYIELTSTPSFSAPILAATFKRDPITRETSYALRVDQRTSFSGLYSSGEELETVTLAGKINWVNVDTNKREFIVDKSIDGLTRLFFNKDYTETFGVVPVYYQDLGACEDLGASTGEVYQVFYLPRFPVLVDSSFHLYVVSSSTWTEWTRVDTWWELISTNWSVKNQYYVDKDLGIVYFGDSYNGGIPATGSSIVVGYTTTLRIEYEEEDRSISVIAENADVNPTTQSTNQGFVCISHSALEAANIVLDIDKSIIPGTTTYGPIYAGSDYALLRATVTSASNDPVPDVEVLFSMVPDTCGYLDGGNESTSVTDSVGHAYSTYQPPTTGDEMGYYSTLVQDSTNAYYPDDRELIIQDASASLLGLEEEVYLFMILKDDIILGYKTVDDFLLAMFRADPPQWVPSAGIPPTPVAGDEYDRWKAEIILTYDLKDWEEPAAAGSPVSGRKVVVYQTNNIDNLDPYALNPVTGTLGAIMPVYPLAITQITNGFWRLTYPDGALIDTGVDSTVGSYWLASPKLIRFQASCWSPYYNRRIYSNIITAKVSLPDYMLGVYVNSLSQKIPFGWKIIGDEDNVAAALDGATFITINPFGGPYPIIDLVGDSEETGDWADAPFRVANFKFSV
jgi:hypothetical protein